MARKEIDYSHLDTAWGFYLKDKRPKEVHRRCLAAGMRVHKNTISNWINKGIPSQKILSFKVRLAKIEKDADRVLGEAEEAARVEVIVQANARRDAAVVVIAANNLDQWQHQLNQQLIHAAIANDKMIEALMGVDPADTGALKDVMTAWKNAVSAQRGIIETHSVIKGLTPGQDKDGRDDWIAEHFEEFTNDEHRAFRDKGEWPERLEVPEFILKSLKPSEEE